MRPFFQEQHKRACATALGNSASGDCCWENFGAVRELLLLDYFDGEEQAEFKAQLMAGALVRFLNRLGEERALTEDQLNEAVMTILVSGKAAIVDAANDVCIE